MLRAFGHYLLEERIATGGMARVYRARLRGLGGFEKTLVVKQILPELASDPRFVRMFVEEAKAAVRLSHPHIVPVYELGEVEGTYFLAMEFVEGVSVAELLRDGPLGAAATAHLGAQLADALDYAHGRGLVHRDVTPRNVLVDRAGHARLLDFGVAAPADAKAPVFGTPGYMPPEQARGEAVDRRADVFALGALLYEAVTGRAAFPEVHGARAAHEAVPSASPPPLRSVPEPLAEAIERAIQLEPKGRFERASHLGRSLRSWLASEHPAGVADLLGERVARVLRAREMRTEQERADASDEAPQVATAPVRTLAAAPALSRVLSGAEVPRPSGDEGTDASDVPATVPMEGRRPPRPSVDPAPALPRGSPHVSSRSTGRVAMWIAAGSAVLLGIWLFGRGGEPAPAPPVESSAGRGSSEAASGPAVSAGGRAVRDGEGADAAEDAGVERDERPPPAHTEPSSAARAGSKAAAPRAEGWLSVSALPWAEVRLDGRLLGRTPLRARAVRAGRHRLRLACPPLGVQLERVIEVPVSGHLRAEADLESEPPWLRVRSLSPAAGDRVAPLRHGR